MANHNSNNTLRRSFAAACVALALAACSSTSPERVQTMVQTQVTDAAKTPLNDLNLVQAEIPAALQAAQAEPYGMPKDTSCSGLNTEIAELDAVLGADLDAPATDKNPSLIDRATNEARRAASGALKGAVEGAIPYRSWVRKLSGAERYSKKVSAAIASGTVRRAFLKGLRVNAAC
jgi:hypothetical protein